MRHETKRNPTRTFVRSAAVATLALLLAACAPRYMPIELSAGPTDLAALAGEWVGDYEGRQSGRSGSIVFRLDEGTDHAYGDVVMTPLGAMQRPGTSATYADAREASCAAAVASQVLAILFVRAEVGFVRGFLEPYRDPEHGCMVETTFTGKMTSDSTIEGTFITRGVGLPTVQTGTWKVTRHARSGR